MREIKDSGFEWLGKVSSDVKLVPLKYLLKKERMPIKVGPFGSQLSGADFLKEESDFWVYNQRTVLDENYESGDAYISYDKYETMSGFHVYEDDILITTRGTIGKITRIPHLHKPGILHPCIIRFRIDDSKYNYRLLKLLFNQSDFVTSQILYKSNATTIEVIYSDTLKNIILPVWDMKTQGKIADFLDAKCAEIDALTADIQTQIDTLEQYKRSVITETVTKGLNPDAEMKDSGIEWVGQIPMSWKVLKGKHLFAQRSLRGNSIELQLLSPTQRFGVIPQALYEELTGMSAVKLNEKADLSLLKTIHKRDFCISLRSFQGGFEYSEYEGVVSPAYQVFYPTVEIADGYYKYLFKEQGFIEKMNSYTMTLRDGKNIAFSDFGSTYVPYPPLREQAEIAAYLNKKCDQIDVLIAEKQQQIATLDEYKKSLIFEYVTGKKEVPLS